MTFEQIHDGTYSANAVLDRNRNMTAGVLLPDTGDAIAWPLDVSATVPESGTGTVGDDITITTHQRLVEPIKTS